MNVKFGNLTVEQFEQRVGTQFTDEERMTLESYRTDQANFESSTRFHIFDDPAITIDIGVQAFDVVKPIMEAAQKRAPFNRPVSFYPRGDGWAA